MTDPNPAFAAPPVDTVDIGAYRIGNTGIPYVTTLDSGRPGPHVMVNALTHGNEVSGAHALVRLIEAGIAPAHGRLTWSFANVAAFEAFDPAEPFAARYLDEDFNRVWDRETLDGPRRSRELDRAREMRPLIDTVDYLLDLHSTSLAMAPMALCGRRDKGLALARGTGYPAHVVIDDGHAAGRRLRDYAFFDDPGDPRAALLVECGQHFAAEAPVVAIETTLRFLRHCGVIEATADAASQPRARPGAQCVVHVTEAVTVSSDDFAFTRAFAGFEVVAKAGTVFAHDGGRALRTPYDDCVMVMPSRDLAPGLTAVRLGRRVARAGPRDHGHLPTI